MSVITSIHAIVRLILLPADIICFTAHPFPVDEYLHDPRGIAVQSLKDYHSPKEAYEAACDAIRMYTDKWLKGEKELKSASRLTRAVAAISNVADHTKQVMERFSISQSSGT